MRSLTRGQASRLRILGGGAIALVPGRRDWTPLLRRGLVEPLTEDDGSRYLPPLRITPDGLRALADATERYPELAPELKRSESQQLDEHPVVTELRGKLAAAREERNTARREASGLRWKARSAARYLADMLEDN